MTQPTAYVHTTDFSQEENNKVSGRSTVRTPQLDAEFDNIQLCADGILRSLAMIQRDDGALADGLVTLYNLSSSVLALLSSSGSVVRGVWQQNTQYAYRDIVEVAGSSYLGVVAHLSGIDFAVDKAAGKWIFLSSTSSAAATSFAPTTTIASTNVQAAIAELDTELRTGVNISMYRPQRGV